MILHKIALYLSVGEFCMLVCRLQTYFSKLTFSKNYFRITIRVSNSLDPDQAQHVVGPDLGPNCLQKLSADDTSRQRVKIVSTTLTLPCQKYAWVDKLLIHKFVNFSKV